MAKGWMLYWTDLANAVAFGGMLATGAVLKWVLPHGGGGAGGGHGGGRSRAGPDVEWLGLGRHDWGDIHFWLAVAATGLVLLHLSQHLGWIVQATRRYLFRSHPTPVTHAPRRPASV